MASTFPDVHLKLGKLVAIDRTLTDAVLSLERATGKSRDTILIYFDSVPQNIELKARLARAVLRCVVHQVTQRGASSMDIFMDDQDRELYLKLL